MNRRLLRGTQPIVGFIIPPTVPLATARRTILSHWVPGCEVHVQNRWLRVVYTAPRWQSADTLPGIPFIRRGEVLSCVEELDPAIRQATLVTLWKGEEIRLPEYNWQREDPATWLAPLSFGRLDLYPPPPLVRAIPVVAPPTKIKPIHEILGGGRLAPAPDRLLATSPDLFNSTIVSSWLQRFSANLRDRASATTNNTVGRFADWLSAKVMSAATRLASATPTPNLAPLGPARPPSAFWQSVAAGIGSLGNGMGRLLGPLVAHRQMVYMLHTINLFRLGRMDEALRRAVPLGHASGALMGAVGGLIFIPALMLFSPALRRSLQLGAGFSQIVQAFTAGGTKMTDTLRKVYLEAFEKLDNEGRYEEAAYVRAELLRDIVGACAYLEQKGLAHKAAELAEAHHLAPAERARYWISAGQFGRGFAIARAAVTLEATAGQLATLGKHDAAQMVRTAQAIDLAASGQYLAASRIAESLPPARHLAARWAELAWQRQPDLTPEAMAERLALGSEAHEGLITEIGTLLTASDEDSIEWRRRFAVAVGKAAPNPGTRAAARLVLRQYLADLGEGLLPERANHRDMIRILTVASEDRALTADLPPAGKQQPGEKKAAHHLLLEKPLVDTHFVSLQGTQEARHAIPLPGQRMAVAVGEAGTYLIDRKGNAAAHFPGAADQLIYDHFGQRVLALCIRPIGVRVTRLHLDEGTTRYLGEYPLTCWSPRHDGLMWSVFSGPRMLYLDVHSDRLEPLWEHPGPIGNATPIGMIKDAQTVATNIIAKQMDGTLLSVGVSSLPPKSPHVVRLDQYIRTGTRLTASDMLMTRSAIVHRLHAEGVLLRTGKRDGSGWNLVRVTQSEVIHLPLDAPGSGDHTTYSGAMTDQWIATGTLYRERMDGFVNILNRGTQTYSMAIRMQLVLEGLRNHPKPAISIEPCEEGFIIADSLGRVVRLDLSGGKVAVHATAI